MVSKFVEKKERRGEGRDANHILRGLAFTLCHRSLIVWGITATYSAWYPKTAPTVKACVCPSSMA